MCKSCGCGCSKPNCNGACKKTKKKAAKKALSPKQKNLAATAGDPKKIDAADFAAKRAGK